MLTELQMPKLLPSIKFRDALLEKHEQMRFSHWEQLVHESYRSDAELVERVICNMKRGKAAGLLGVTAEHLQYYQVLVSSTWWFILVMF